MVAKKVDNGLPWFMRPTKVPKKGKKGFGPELYARKIDVKDRAILRRAQDFFARKHEYYRMEHEKSYEEMSMMGAPASEMFGIYDPYLNAYRDTIKKYPISKKYIMRPSGRAGEDTAYGKRDFYGGL